MSFYPGINFGGFWTGSLISGEGRLAALDCFCSWRWAWQQTPQFLTLSGVKWPNRMLWPLTLFLCESLSTFAVPSPKGHLIPKLAVCKLSSRSINSPINLDTWERMAGGHETGSDTSKSQSQRNTQAAWRFHSKRFWKHWDQLVRLLETRLSQFWPRLNMCLHLNLICKDNAQHLILSCFVFPFLC